MNVCSIRSMSLEPGVTPDVVVAPNKHDVGGVPLTNKLRHAVVYFAAWRFSQSAAAMQPAVNDIGTCPLQTRWGQGHTCCCHCCCMARVVSCCHCWCSCCCMACVTRVSQLLFLLLSLLLPGVWSYSSALI
jgi:hypothetical protein